MEWGEAAWSWWGKREHGHQAREKPEGALEEETEAVNHSVGGLPLPELSGVGKKRDSGVGAAWGIATSGRQVSGTVQAVVSFPAKGEEGRRAS